MWRQITSIRMSLLLIDQLILIWHCLKWCDISLMPLTEESKLTHNFDMSMMHLWQTFLVSKQWFMESGLCLDKNKTQEVIFSLSHPNFQTGLTEVKLLEFTLDKKVTWRRVHTNSVCTRALHHLQRLKPQCCLISIIRLWIAMFHSHVSSGI